MQIVHKSIDIEDVLRNNISDLDGNATREQETLIYPNRYCIGVMLNGNLIGYAIRNSCCVYKRSITTENVSYWSAYCIVPIEWFRKKSLIATDNIPEITYMNKKSNIIGWDYIHYWDLFSYTNLYSVIIKIYDVWKIIHGK
jgi:hypothetical protein